MDTALREPLNHEADGPEVGFEYWQLRWESRRSARPQFIRGAVLA